MLIKHATHTFSVDKSKDNFVVSPTSKSNLKDLSLNYKYVKSALDTNDTSRNLEKAFDVLFEIAFKNSKPKKYGNKNKK